MNLIGDETANKYGIVFEGFQRFYELNVGERLFDLEYTTPHTFLVGGQSFSCSSWSELLTTVVKYFLDIFPEKMPEITNFKTNWSSASIFFTDKRTNSCEIGSGFFLNINHTALHSCWLLYDLLNWFGIPFSSCRLIVHRMPKAEPEPVRNEIKKNFLAGFSDFLKWKKLIAPANILVILKNVEYLETKYCQIRGARSGYDSLYLFDEPNMYSAAKSKFYVDLKNKVFPGKDKQLGMAKRYLDYLTEYYGTFY